MVTGMPEDTVSLRKQWYCSHVGWVFRIAEALAKVASSPRGVATPRGVAVGVGMRGNEVSSALSHTCMLGAAHHLKLLRQEAKVSQFRLLGETVKVR